jgi:hypothetical protein
MNDKTNTDQTIKKIYLKISDLLATFDPTLLSEGIFAMLKVCRAMNQKLMALAKDPNIHPIQLL